MNTGFLTKVLQMYCMVSTWFTATFTYSSVLSTNTNLLEQSSENSVDYAENIT